MSENIRIGIIGAGGIVRERHLPGFAGIEGVKIMAVCNRTPESTHRVADEYNIPLRYQDWHEVIQSPEVDAVLIGTWPYLHMEATLEAFAQGKAVFCQARMARNAREAHLMRDAQKTTGLPAMLCPAPHGMKWHHSMKRLLDEGYVGQVATIRIQSLQSRYLDPHAPLAWRQDFHLSGYNVLTLGIYAEVVRRWFGDYQSIQAIGQIMTEERVEPVSGLMEKVHIPDAVWVTARMVSGAIAQYSLSGIAHAGGGDRIEVYGSAGTLVYDIDNDRLLGAGLDEGTLKEITLPDDESKGWEVEMDFIRVVRGQMDPSPSFDDGVAYMDVVEATARSCHSGMRIELPLEDPAHGR